LNRIYAVLSDPERRRRYDELLDEQYLPTVVVGAITDPVFRESMAKVAWIAAIAVSAVLLVWLAWETTPGAQTHARDQTAFQTYPAAAESRSTVDSSEESSLIARLRSDLRAATLERDAAIHELQRLQLRA
jgi:hypothetical protein